MTRWFVVFACAFGCERTPAPTPATQTEAPTTIATPVVRTDEVPPPVAPANPDYEDAAGVVRQATMGWMIEIEGGRPICLPFEAPAEARRDGAQVRFTLYLAETGQGCRDVQTLVSMSVAN